MFHNQNYGYYANKYVLQVSAITDIVHNNYYDNMLTKITV